MTVSAASTLENKARVTPRRPWAAAACGPSQEKHQPRLSGFCPREGPQATGRLQARKLQEAPLPLKASPDPCECGLVLSAASVPISFASG